MSEIYVRRVEGKIHVNTRRRNGGFGGPGEPCESISSKNVGKGGDTEGYLNYYKSFQVRCLVRKKFRERARQLRRRGGQLLSFFTLKVVLPNCFRWFFRIIASTKF